MPSISNIVKRLITDHGVALAVICIALISGGDRYQAWSGSGITLLLYAIPFILIFTAFGLSRKPQQKQSPETAPAQSSRSFADRWLPVAKLLAVGFGLSALLPTLRLLMPEDPFPAINYYLLAAGIITIYVILALNCRHGEADAKTTTLPAPAAFGLAAAAVIAAGLFYPLTDWYDAFYATAIGALNIGVTSSYWLDRDQSQSSDPNNSPRDAAAPEPTP